MLNSSQDDDLNSQPRSRFYPVPQLEDGTSTAQTTADHLDCEVSDLPDRLAALDDSDLAALLTEIAQADYSLADWLNQRSEKYGDVQDNSLEVRLEQEWEQ
jgi:DNA-binding transcriptional regulator YbjK